MIDATTPTAHLTTTPRFDAPGRMCDLQWRRWRGPVTVWMGAQQWTTREFVTTLQQAHRQWLTSLLARGIPIRAIRRLELDDPREPRATLEQRTQEYIERKTKRRRRNDDHANDEGTRSQQTTHRT
jgi:hypothetical protein